MFIIQFDFLKLRGVHLGSRGGGPGAGPATRAQLDEVAAPGHQGKGQPDMS